MFGTGVSDLTVYDRPAADGLHGGSPHLHTLCAEAYAVVAGSGSVQTLTWDGYQETALLPGSVVWFTPGTVHRLVNGGDLAHLREAAVTRMSAVPRDGMCGHLLTYPTDLPGLSGLSRPPDPPEDPDGT